MASSTDRPARMNFPRPASGHGTARRHGGDPLEVSRRRPDCAKIFHSDSLAPNVDDFSGESEPARGKSKFDNGRHRRWHRSFDQSQPRPPFDPMHAERSRAPWRAAAERGALVVSARRAKTRGIEFRIVGGGRKEVASRRVHDQRSRSMSNHIRRRSLPSSSPRIAHILDPIPNVPARACALVGVVAFAVANR